MKRKIIIITLAAAMTASMLTACAENNSASSAKGGTQNQTQSEAVTEAITLPQESTSQSSSSDEEIDYSGIAQELFGALDQIDRLGGTAVPYDETVSYTEGETVFYLLPKMPYSSIADLKEYMESYLTEDMIASRYSGIIGTDNPLYIDHDGELYVRSNARGCGFAFYQEDNQPEISNQSESGFTAQMDYDNYGGKSTLEIEVVKEGDFWKINGFSIK